MTVAQGSPEWFLQRLGKVTVSNAHQHVHWQVLRHDRTGQEWPTLVPTANAFFVSKVPETQSQYQ